MSLSIPKYHEVSMSDNMIFINVKSSTKLCIIGDVDVKKFSGFIKNKHCSQDINSSITVMKHEVKERRYENIFDY